MIYLRRTFHLPDGIDLQNLRFWLAHDEDVEVYINGVPALKRDGYRYDYALYTVSADALTALKTGRNTLAVRCRQSTGDSSSMSDWSSCRTDGLTRRCSSASGIHPRGIVNRPTTFVSRRSRKGMDPRGLVDPLQGADSTHSFSKGNTLPLVGVPRGMTYWTPLGLSHRRLSFLSTGDFTRRGSLLFSPPQSRWVVRICHRRTSLSGGFRE